MLLRMIGQIKVSGDRFRCVFVVFLYVAKVFSESVGINGVAMGRKMGPNHANLFVGYIEHEFFNQYNGPKPELYRRYIDDCVGATSSTREELNQFITAVNSFHPALKYTCEISNTSLAFLDIKLFIEGNGLCTSVHYKPTDCHSYLLYSSSHPSHVKNSIPYSQLLRLRHL